MDVKKGDMFYADLGHDNIKNSEQYGIRPVLIISNDKGNIYSPTVIVAPLTSKMKRQDLPIHIAITKDKNNGLELNSVALLEQITTIDKSRLITKIGCICDDDLKKINQSLKISLDL